MKNYIPSLLALALLSIGCGGSGSSVGGGRGLIYLNDSGVAGTNLLHRMAKGGGTPVDVNGSTSVFTGSMDENFNVITSNSNGNIVKLVNGIGNELTSSTHDFRPCVTPIGNTIAFVSSRDGNNEIYTMSGTGAGQLNVSNSSAEDTFPAISKDGTKVVFASGRDGNDEIYIVNYDGTGLTRLTNNAAEDTTPAFTADGTHVIFSSDRGGSAEIYQMDLTGGSVVKLTTDPSHDKYHVSFDIDGTHIYYYTANGTRQIWRCNADGSNPVQLTTGSTDSSKTSTWVY